MFSWVRIPIPYIAERFIAFSIPDDRHFYAISYEGVHEIVLSPELVVTSDDSHPEGIGVFNGRRIAYKGETLPTLGLYGGAAIIADDSGHILDLRPPDRAEATNGEVNILRSDGELVQSLPFIDYSGDWQQATFSTNYRHIAIGTPYTITLYRRT